MATWEYLILALPQFESPTTGPEGSAAAHALNAELTTMGVIGGCSAACAHGDPSDLSAGRRQAREPQEAISRRAPGRRSRRSMPTLVPSANLCCLHSTAPR